MLVQVWTTQDFPEDEQFSALRELMMSGPLPMTVERPGVASTDPIRSQMELHAFGQATMLASRSEPAMGTRGKPEISRTSNDFVCVLQPRVSAWYDLAGKTVEVRPGDLVFSDSETPIAAGGADVDFRLWMMPRSLVSPWLRRPEDRLGAHIRAESPMTPLIHAYLDHLGPALDAAGPLGGQELITTLARLIAVERGISGEAAELGQDASRAARLAQLKQLIALQMEDPGLSPGSAAAALGISVRQVHLLFEPSGTSFSQFVTAERLRRVRDRLQSPVHAHRSVAEIAYGSGFESLAAFYRAFRAAYGHAPRELRPASAPKP